MFQFNKKIQESLDLTESLVLSSPRVLCPRFFLQGPGSLYRVLGPGSSQSTVSCSQDLGSSVLSVGSLVVNPHRILGLGSVYMVLGTFIWSAFFVVSRGSCVMGPQKFLYLGFFPLGARSETLPLVSWVLDPDRIFCYYLSVCHCRLD